MARPPSPVARQLRRRLLVAGVVVAALLGLLFATCSRSEAPARVRLVVFAAASLTDAMRGVEEAFEAEYPDADLIVSVGASSTLARQIEAGAPADVFLSASPAWTDYLAARGRLRTPPRVLFRNRLVVVGPAQAPSLRSLRGLLALERIALADPSHVPAGQYARAGLQRAGLWEAVEPRAVPVADVRAALAAVQRGAADAAIVYASDLRAASGVRVLLAWPERYAPDVRFTAAVLRAAPHPDRALELFEWLRQPERAGLWQRYGLVPPAEPVTAP